MQKPYTAFILACFGLVVGAGTATHGSPPASPRAPVDPPVATSSIDHDVSPALRDIPPVVPVWARKGGRTISNRPLLRRRSPRSSARNRSNPDPVVQEAPGPLSMPGLLQSFEGLGNVDGVLPPDPNGAVGPNHYVQWVNISFAIYDKSGNLLYGPAAGNTLWTGFGGPCELTNDGDPIVLHDELADRWFMSQLALPYFPFGPFYQCIAVSQTSDPTGAYHRYAFKISDTKINDYPKFGIWPDAYYMAVNQFSEVSDTWAGQGVVAFERDKMLAGLPARMVYFDLFAFDPSLGGMLPADLDGAAPAAGTPNYYVQFDDDAAGVASQDQLQLWEFHVDWRDPSTSSFTGPTILPTAPFDSDLCGYNRNCIPQPRTRRRLDAISDRMMYRVQYRNFGSHEALVLNHTVDTGSDHAGIRWYEIRDPGGTPTIYQQGTYAPDSDHRWMGSIAMDGAGNLALGFSVSSKSTYPSIRYVGRLADDLLGVLPQEEAEIVTGFGSQTDASSRWGDYSSLTVDPIDQCTFWYTQEYYATTSSIGWQTRIASFTFPSCTADAPFVTLVATVPNASEADLTPGTVTATRTGGTSAALTVSYTVGGTATGGADYDALGGSVTIPEGAATATIAVTPIDDTSIEGDETVIVTLAPDASYAVGTPSSAIITIVNDDLPPDLVVSALTVPRTAGAGQTITVDDTTTNQGADAAPASTTTFYLSTNSALDASDVILGSRALGPLAAGEASAGSTAMTIPTATGAGRFYIIAKADGPDVVPETQETNNTTAKTISVGPDLVLTSLTVPSTGGAGQTITIEDITQNQGAGATPASTTTFHLSTNTTLDASDVILGSRAVAPLGAGEASSGSTAVTIPAATGTGLFYVIAKADAPNDIPETLETNNRTFQAIRIGPDLVLTSLTVPSMAGAGQTITVDDTTTNQGAGAAPTSTTAFYLSTDTSIDATDVSLGSRTVGPLAAGEASAGSTAVTIPAATGAGVFYVIAKADGPNVVAETLETNNRILRTIRIGPDLVITSLTAPGAAGAGQTISVDDITLNQGTGGAPTSITAFYLSTNTTLDATDVELGSRTVGPLAAGEASAGSTAVTIPAATGAGLFYLIAKADGPNLVAETLETNNRSLTPIRIGPDLVLVSLTAPSTGVAGQTITIEDTTKNQGAGTAPSSLTTFYFSTDTSLDGADVVLGSRIVGPLAAGEASAGSTAVTIPPATGAGLFYVIAKADGSDAIAETLETNNTTATSTSIGPDLVIASLIVPSAAGAGQTITIDDITENQGMSAAPASTTTFYLSTNLSLDGTDVVVGSRAVGPLAGGEASSGSTGVTIPPATGAGRFYIIAKADAPGTVAEMIETNNRAVRSILIGPDLVLTSLTVPSTGGSGQEITIDDTTMNQGAGNVPTSTTTFYLSTDTALDGTDVVLGSRTVGPLAAGEASAGSTAVTIPPATGAGRFYVIGMADAPDSIPETLETNNTTFAPISIGLDLAVTSLTVPSTAGAGQTITVDDTTTNQGTGIAPASTTTFYLSTNTSLDGADVVLGSRTVGLLAAGEASVGSTAVIIPAATGVGLFYVIAKADASEAIAETLETNNTTFTSIRIGPDLLIASLTVPGSAGAGQTITIDDTTLNQGAGTAAASTTTFYLSTDTSLDSGDSVLASRAVGPLAAGEASAVSTVVTIPAGTGAGLVYIIARADAADAVAETLETNNRAFRPISIGADLAITSLTTPSTAGAGQTITVDDTTTNQGAGAAPSSITTFYLSINTAIDAADAILGSRSVDPLAAGEASAASTPVTIPEGTATGSYYVIAKADADDAVVETLESNNSRFRSIRIGPDLVLASFSVPGSAGAGQTITAGDTTTNQGAGAAPASTTTFYLSTDTRIDGADVVLGSRAVNPLAPGEASVGSTPLAVPAGTATGFYYVIGKADAANAVAETLETNNRNLASIRIDPDLAVTALTMPPTAAAGQTTPVDDTTTNQGADAAPASTTTFYLSTNTSVDGTDVVLGSRAVNPLAPGEASVGSTPLAVPAGTATGFFYVIAKADAPGTVAETQETNNTTFRRIQISSGS